MSEQKFIGYIQEPDLHDGVIVTATYKSGFLRSVYATSFPSINYQRRVHGT